MLGLPQRTEYERHIAKEKFYGKLEMSEAEKSLFVNEVQSIYWMNKLSPESMNLSISGGIEEIEVFRVSLKAKKLSRKVLTLIDEGIVHPILFVLEFGGDHCLCMAYKERKESGNVQVKEYYCTGWSPKETIDVEFMGLSTGEIFERILKQLSGDRLGSTADSKEELGDLVSKDLEYQKDMKEISKLEKQMNNTLQPNKKLELNRQIRKIKSKWGV